MGACAFNGAIYQFAGGSPSALAWHGQSWRYDPASDSWVQLTDLPGERQFGSAVVVEDRIWFPGGWGFDAGIYCLSDVFVFDPTANGGFGEWSDNPRLPAQDAAGHGLRSFGIGVIDGKVIVAGGYAVVSTVTDGCHGFDTANPAAGWMPKAPMPATFAAGASGVADGRLYLMGGVLRPGAVYEYDPTTDAWATRASIPGDRTHVSAAGLSVGGIDRIYLPGGVQLVSGSAGVLQATNFEFTQPQRPRISGLTQAHPDGPALPEGSWMGPMVRLAATATDSSGADLFIEGQVTPEGRSFCIWVDLRVQTSSGVEATEVVGPFPEGAYRWRCRAVTSAGVAGPWVEFGTAGVGPDFQVDGTIPTRPFGLEPSSRVRVFERHGGPVVFRWTPAVDDRGEPVTYEVEIDVLPTFANASPQPAASSPHTLQVAPNRDQQMYYWRVRAVDPVGNRGIGASR